MAFNWLKPFHQNMSKPANYAEKSLAAYKLGMRSQGSIAGVQLEVPVGCCAAAARLDSDQIYHPDDAPHFPLATCDQATTCPCVYRPVMFYQLDEADAERLKAAQAERSAKEKEEKRSKRKDHK